MCVCERKKERERERGGGRWKESVRRERNILTVSGVLRVLYSTHLSSHSKNLLVFY